MANNTSQFGSGTLFLNPTGGTLAANPTPIRLGILQDIDVQMKGETVKLYGQNRLPDIVAPSEIDISIKATFASMQGLVLSQAFLIGTVVSGVKQTVDQESHSVPAVSTYTITVTNSANFLVDLGVQYAATTRNFTRVASGPTVGEYSVSAGVYTFAAADASAPIVISYTYTLTASGQTFGFQNQKQGVGPSCQIVIYEPYSNLLRGYLFNVCYCKSLSAPTKQKGFVIQTAEFDVADNPGGNVLEYYDVS